MEWEADWEDADADADGGGGGRDWGGGLLGKDVFAFVEEG